MDIHINRVGRHIKIDEVRHLLAIRHEAVIRRCHRLVKVRVLHVTSVHEKVLRHVLLTRRLRLSHKSAHRAETRLHVYRQQKLVYSFARNVHNALTQSARFQAQHLRAIAKQRKRHVRIDQCNAFKSSDYVLQFGVVTLEKLTSCWHIEEQILHNKVAADST